MESQQFPTFQSENLTDPSVSVNWKEDMFGYFNTLTSHLISCEEGKPKLVQCVTFIGIWMCLPDSCSFFVFNLCCLSIFYI